MEDNTIRQKCVTVTGYTLMTLRRRRRKTTLSAEMCHSDWLYTDDVEEEEEEEDNTFGRNVSQ